VWQKVEGTVSTAIEAFADEIAEAVLRKLLRDPDSAKRLRAALGAVDAIYTQDSLPPGMSKRTYHDHCAFGDWPNTKQGRLRVTRKEDFDAWANSRAVVKRVRSTECSGSALADLEAARWKGIAKCQLKRKVT